ncbi:MAG: peptidylprolyl isomerase [Spirochaetia bacterium]|nr:peptidylprolyl isomerase [Spirochaetia bacterium]
MRKIGLAVLIIFTILTGSLWADVIGETVATVNLTRTEGITARQVDKKLAEIRNMGTQTGIQPDKITREQVLDSLISEVLIKQAAERDGVRVQQEDIDRLVNQQKRQIEAQMGQKLSDQEFQSIVSQETGYSWQEYRQRLEDQILQQTYITQKKRGMFEAINPPTEREIQALYRENATEFTNPEFVRISHVFIPLANKSEAEQEEARRKIEKARTQLRSGEMSFDDLVLKYSEDENSKFSGGDVGFVTRNNQQVKQVYGENFFDEIFELEEGEVSDIIESNVGFHIVKATTHEQPKILSLDDRIAPDNPTTVREYLRNRIYQERQQQTLQQAMNDVMEELREQAEIVRYD